MNFKNKKYSSKRASLEFDLSGFGENGSPSPAVNLLCVPSSVSAPSIVAEGTEQGPAFLH